MKPAVWPSHPLLYQVNARVLVNELSREMGKKISLATLPDRLIDEWASYGFDAIWLMGVWTTGTIGLEIARTNPVLLEQYERTLPDFAIDDVVGSPYAVKSYTVSPMLGRNAGLAALRKRLAKKGMSLILDFVSNHTARDHAWVEKSPEFYVNGSKGDDVTSPDRFFSADTSKGQKVLAYGRDPYFPGWTDTAQLNIKHPRTRQAMIRELRKIAAICDGIRCDMAMLLLQEVFESTWGDLGKPVDASPATGEFWSEAIEEVRKDYPSFMFIAECYWNREWQMQKLGFNYTYDKILYDRLLREGAPSVQEHLRADLDYQKHSLRFLENHDEPRAAQTLPSHSWHFAAATVAATVPGMMMFHEGQLEGRKLRTPIQLGRRPVEPVSEPIRMFYHRLLASIGDPTFKEGEWKLLNAKPAWHDNETWRDFIVFWWRGASGERFVVVNYAPQNGQCYIEMGLQGFTGSRIEFRDILGEATYVRDKGSLLTKGMYFDLPPYGVHMFDVKPM